VNPTALLGFPHSEAKILQVLLMGLSPLKNNAAGLPNHTHVKPTIKKIEMNTPKRYDHIDSKKLTVKQARQDLKNHFHSKEIYTYFILIHSEYISSNLLDYI